MSEKILVAVDGSTHMARTLKKAIDMTRKDNSELIVLHVIAPHVLSQEEVEFAEKRCGETFKKLVRGDGLPVFPVEQDAERKYIGDYIKARKIFQNVYGEDILKRAKELLDEEGISNVKTLLESGEVAKTVLDVAKKQEADLIIVGRRGHSRIADFFLGSTAQTILQYADRSVLTVE
ncbi:MAG: universal stress protein [Hyphomicrobiaceae bacterium]|nr:universal stress protein [Hyphomicrobiaceae bacterium]